MRPRARPQFESLLRVQVAAACLFASACASLSTSNSENTLALCPLNSEDQQVEVLKIAPLGTPREEAHRKLAKAGFELSPGVSKSVSYCTVWNHGRDERWAMDVALLFDESGNLYQTRRAQSETAYDTPPDTSVTFRGRQPSSTSGRSAPADDEPRTPFANPRTRNP